MRLSLFLLFALAFILSCTTPQRYLASSTGDSDSHILYKNKLKALLDQNAFKEFSLLSGDDMPALPKSVLELPTYFNKLRERLLDTKKSPVTITVEGVTYEIDSKAIGEGARGVVYRLKDSSFVVKIPKGDFTSIYRSFEENKIAKEFNREFSNQAVTAPKLYSENSYQILAVKDFIKGRNLGAWVTESDLESDALLKTVLKKLFDFHKAHPHAILDLNPDNFIWDGKTIFYVDNGKPPQRTIERYEKIETFENFLSELKTYSTAHYNPNFFELIKQEHPVGVQVFPDHLQTYDELIEYHKKKWPGERPYKKKDGVLTIQQGDDTLSIYMKGDTFIQSSTQSDRLVQSFETRQFGRGGMWQELFSFYELDDDLKEFIAQGEKTFDVTIHNGTGASESFLEVEGNRAALNVRKDQRTNKLKLDIYLSKRFAKHPSIALTHETQHVLNQFTLDSLLKKVLPRELWRHPPTYRKIFGIMDEFLASEREIWAYKKLVKKNPFMINVELERLLNMSKMDRLEFVLQKYGPYFQVSMKDIESMGLRELFSEITVETVDKKLRQFKLVDHGVIPRGHRHHLYAEQTFNDLSVIHEDYSRPEESDLNKVFRPEERKIFTIPYIDMDQSDLHIIGHEKDFLAKTKEGKVRFFIHPESIDWYKDLYNKYPLQYGDYLASSTSSARTLLIWNRYEESEVYYHKVSLGVEQSGRTREVRPKEALHGVMMSNGLRDIPKDYFVQISLRPIFEPIAVIPKKSEYGVIVREADEHMDRLIPFFHMVGRDDENSVIQLEKYASVAGLEMNEYVEKKLLTPLLVAVVDLYKDHGFVPELHGQNLLIELDDKGVPIGFAFRDLSGVAMDSDIKSAQGQNINFVTDHQNHKYYDEAYHITRGQNYFDKAINVHLKKGIGGSLDLALKALGYDYGDDYFQKKIEILFSDILMTRYEVDTSDEFWLEKLKKAQKRARGESLKSCSQWMKAAL